MLRRVIAVVAVAVGLSTAALGEERGLDRVALVIGNSAYLHTSQIPNPANDARDIAAALGRLGFAVDLRLNLDKRGMDDAIRRFGDRRGTASAGLIYFAGHGLQVDGQNYLLPVDAKLEKERDLKYETVSLTDMLFETERTSGINVIILDACRNNPLASSLARRMGRTRAALVGRGLARVEGAVGTLIAYATRDGTTAADGEGRNSPYTTGVLEWIEKPGLEISMMFRRVRESVMAATNEQQVPWEYGSLTGEFYFRAPGKLPADEPEVAAPSPVVAVDREALFWQSIEDSDGPAMFEAYLEQYPDGEFARIAKLKLEAATKAKEQQTALVVPPKPEIEIEIDPIEAEYVAVKNANVREAPTVRSTRLATLIAGASVHVAGKVKGRNWYLVERDDKPLGYVYGELLKDSETVRQEEEARREEARKLAEEAKRREEARKLAEEAKLALAPPPKPQVPSTTQPAVGVYPSARQPGESFRDCPDCPEMVVIPAGNFMMGSAKSEAGSIGPSFVTDTPAGNAAGRWWSPRRRGPPHQVTIARAFALGRHEVTYDEWNACLRDGGCTHRPSKRGREPVTWMGWDQAKAYVRWLSRKSGQEYRLPSEAEWAYAARRENSLGLQGIEGKIWEWVEDCWNDDYNGAPNNGNAWTTGDCARRVLRGGPWNSGPGGLPAASAFGYHTGVRYVDFGFRIARTLP